MTPSKKRSQTASIAKERLQIVVSHHRKSKNLPDFVTHLEKDILNVGASEGGFKKLKIKVTGGTVYVTRMVLTYGNGTREEIPLRYTFRKGAESRIIDLRGETRVIRKIAFTYDRKNTAKSAKIWVAGKK